MENDPVTNQTGEKAVAQRDLVWTVGCIAITAIAAFLRFWQLGLKPFHHDEGVNGFFLTNLVRQGAYKYDPANYHGPTLYYLALPFAKLFGLETVPMRVSVAIFGLGTVLLIFFLKKYLGRNGTLLAALFVALSPGMVFISRYFIHEILFVFLSLAIVVAVIYFMEREKAGPIAIGFVAALLFTALIPSVINLSAYLAGDNTGALWAFRISFFIVECLLVGMVIRMLLRWENGRPVYLLLAAAAASLLFATKETTFITLGTMLIASLCIWVWQSIRSSESFARNSAPILIGAHVLLVMVALFYRREVVDAGQWVYEYFLVTNKPPETLLFVSVIALALTAIAAWAVFALGVGRPGEPSFTEPVELGWKRFRSSMGGGSDLLLGIAMVAAVFIYLGALFFSSFFTYSEGVSRAFEAYAIWTKTGGKEHTQSGYAGYLKWLTKVESPLLILSTLGILVAMLRGKHRFAMFTALWAVGLFIAYTIIPYKTPWLALSFTLPMCLIGGYGLGELLASKRKELKVLAAAATLIGTSILAYQTYQLNFVRYDDEEMTYVYAHTKRGFMGLIEQINKYAEKSERGNMATIEVISPDYWPMTWYVNDYKFANFHGVPIDVTTSEMIVAKKGDQDAVVAQKYSSQYRFVGVWPLRPGVDLVLLVRRDLAGPEGEELYKIKDYVPPS